MRDGVTVSLFLSFLRVAIPLVATGWLALGLGASRGLGVGRTCSTTSLVVMRMVSTDEVEVVRWRARGLPRVNSFSSAGYVASCGRFLSADVLVGAVALGWRSCGVARQVERGRGSEMVGTEHLVEDTDLGLACNSDGKGAEVVCG